MPESDRERTERQQDAFMFMSLVTTYQQIAWVAMGKVASPTTGKVERELEQARWAIDVLAMLERRMRGNLSDGETRMLREMLHTLRMNYVEEVNRPPEPAEKERAPSSTEQAPAQASSEAQSTSEESSQASGAESPASSSGTGS